MDWVRNCFWPRDHEKLQLERIRLETISLPPRRLVENIPPEECAGNRVFFLQDVDKEQHEAAGMDNCGPFPKYLDQESASVRDAHPLNGNINVVEEQHEAAGMDNCGPFPKYLDQESASVRDAHLLNRNINFVATSLAIQVCGNGPVHKNLVTLQSRLKTFSKWSYWNYNTGQTPNSLSEAGFFYIGNYDHVKCFYCDGGLLDWEPDDNPWIEHARWFPNCSFVVLNKGNSYVEEAYNTNPPVLLSQNKPSMPSPRRVSDQELLDIIDTPLQTAPNLEMKPRQLKTVLHRKILSFVEIAPKENSEAEKESDLNTNYEEELGRSLKSLNVSLEARFDITSEAGSSSSTESSHESVNEKVSTSKSVRKPAIQASNGKIKVSSTEIEENNEVEALSNLASAASEYPGISRTSHKNSDSNCIEGVVKENDLANELRKLRETNQCKICMDNRVEVIFLPCGHLVSCTLCATAMSNCAVCRQSIKAYIKTYLS